MGLERIKIGDKKIKFKRLIGEGGFGAVYEAYYRDRKMAVKVENDKHESLEREYSLYKYLKRKKVGNVPSVYDFYQDDANDVKYLMLEYIDCKSLMQHFKDKSVEFGDRVLIGKIMVSCLKILREIHSVGIIHRDVKPENILYNAENGGVYFVDFGISKKYRTRDGKHYSESMGNHFVGTQRYSSLNAHWGIRLSRRDDLTSLAYTCLMLYLGKLPWQGLGKMDVDKKKTVIKRKKIAFLNNSSVNIPSEFRKFLRFVEDMEYDEEPNYKYLMSLFKEK